MFESKYTQGSTVSFPEFMAERVYMVPFTKKGGLPSHLSRWERTVDAMLDGIDTDSTMYLMIDQGIVKAGSSHRRGGVHIDGNWIAELQCHGTGGGFGHRTSPTSSHRTWGGHASRVESPGGHGTGGGHCAGGLYDESIILASDIAASAGYVGSWAGEIGDGGDCSHVNTEHMDRVILESGVAHIGNVYFLHESLPVNCDLTRTLVRINVPGHVIN